MTRYLFSLSNCTPHGVDSDGINVPSIFYVGTNYIVTDCMVIKLHNGTYYAMEAATSNINANTVIGVFMCYTGDISW